MATTEFHLHSVLSKSFIEIESKKKEILNIIRIREKNKLEELKCSEIFSESTDARPSKKKQRHYQGPTLGEGGVGELTKVT